MADLTRADYERRVDDMRADRLRLHAERWRGNANTPLMDEAIYRYRSVLRRLDWLPPAEIREEGIGRKGICAHS